MKKIISLGSLEMSLHNTNFDEYQKYLDWKVHKLPNGKFKARNNLEKRNYLLSKLNKSEIRGIYVKVN